jgi:ABC-type glycerol-3-phosphate transport system substrate-binding protein
MTKKTITFLFVLLMAFSVFAVACSPAATEEPVAVETEEPAVEPEEPAAEETEAPAAEPEEPAVVETDEPVVVETDEPAMMAVGVDMADLNGVTIEFWHVWDGVVGEALQGIVDEFNATNEYGITVEAYDQGNYGDIFNNMNAAINTGDLPDVAVGYNNQYLAWDAAGNVIVDLTEYVNDPMVGLDEATIADFYPSFWAQDDIDGKRLGIPAQRSGQFMFYNATWAQELGFDGPPTTPEEFKEQACATVEANNTDDNPDNDGTGGWFLNTGSSTLAGWIFAFGGEIENPGEGYNFNTPEAVEAFTFLKEMYDEGCAWTPENRYPNPEFATRQGLYYTSSIAGLPFQQAAFEDVGNTDEWTVIPFPSKGGGDPVIDIYGPSFAMVEATPEEQLASWIFMSWFTEPQNQAAWVESSGYYPTRASTMDYLESYIADNPQWAASRDLLEFGKFEPRYESWSSVRYEMQDAAAEMFQEGFDNATIADLLAELDAAAAELHAETQ